MWWISFFAGTAGILTALYLLAIALVCVVQIMAHFIFLSMVNMKELLLPAYHKVLCGLNTPYAQ
jgi:hypothetical protein